MKYCWRSDGDWPVFSRGITESLSVFRIKRNGLGADGKGETDQDSIFTSVGSC